MFTPLSIITVLQQLDFELTVVARETCQPEIQVLALTCLGWGAETLGSKKKQTQKKAHISNRGLCVLAITDVSKATKALSVGVAICN